uniref:Uncharacterized protein n=1 Tax=Arundo donax TaxID=35708 RepID=A0A0A8YX95_ARUDO
MVYMYIVAYISPNNQHGISMLASCHTAPYAHHASSNHHECSLSQKCVDGGKTSFPSTTRSLQSSVNNYVDTIA